MTEGGEGGGGGLFVERGFGWPSLWVAQLRDRNPAYGGVPFAHAISATPLLAQIWVSSGQLWLWHSRLSLHDAPFGCGAVQRLVRASQNRASLQPSRPVQSAPRAPSDWQVACPLGKPEGSSMFVINEQ